MNRKDLEAVKEEFRVEAREQYKTNEFSVGISVSGGLMVTFNNDEAVPDNLITEFNDVKIEYQYLEGPINFQ